MQKHDFCLTLTNFFFWLTKKVTSVISDTINNQSGGEQPESFFMLNNC